MKKSINFFYIFGAIAFLVALDQASKYIIRHWGGFYICNPNVAFGIHIPDVIFWIFWVAIIMMVGWSLFRGSEERWSAKVALALILSGALANMIDRLTLGCIVDFIDLRVWPVFNLADVFIVSGALVLVVKRMKMC